MEAKGYAGKILKVDLSDGSIATLPLDEQLARGFLGGAGINARLAYDYIKPHTDPLSPANALILGVGPLVGTLAPGAGRSNITSMSPSSHLFGTSGSGHLAALKFAGYDHVIITGRADRPVYLHIGDTIEIREADHIWGGDTWATTEAIWQELDRRYTVLAIGPAGENLVRDASVIANKYSAYARTGMGAVMGSKNLKAIAVYGSQGVAIAHPRRFMELVDKVCADIRDLLDERFHKYGKGLVHLEAVAKAGGLSGRNYREILEGEAIAPFEIDNLIDGVDRRRRSCFSCPIGCKHYLKGKEDSNFAGMNLPISCCGNSVITAVNCGGKDWPEVLRFSELCSRLGMDQISVTGLIAMVIELYEKGIIDDADTGGAVLDWNNETLLALTRAIANRQGIGDVLANGFIEAVQEIGRGAGDYAIHSKGIGTLDPRPFFSPMVFSTLVNATGHFPNTMFFREADETLALNCRKMGIPERDIARILSGPEGYNLASLTKWSDDYSFVLECLGLCMAYTFKEFDLEIWADLYTAATGIKSDTRMLLACAERSWDIKRAFNMREGATRRDDRLSQRFLTESIQFGNATLPPLDEAYIDKLITEYYRERGWDPSEGGIDPVRLRELTGRTGRERAHG